MNGVQLRLPMAIGTVTPRRASSAARASRTSRLRALIGETPANPR